MKAKNILGLLTALLFISHAFAADMPQKELRSTIKGITVYQSAAMVHREATGTLTAGMQEVLISGLSPYINGNSIQVGGSGDLTILSVSSRVNYLSDPAMPKEYKRIKDSLDLMQPKLLQEQAMLGVYQQEEHMLNLNKGIGGQQQGVNVTDLISAVEYYRKRMTEVKLLQLKTQQRINELNQIIQRLNQQLANVNAGQVRSVGEIIILVNVERPHSVSFEVDYLVGNAGWLPLYDIRVDDISSPATLVQKAKLWQRTGVDWDNVKLTLSTADPNRSSILPVLSPWWLNYVRPVKERSRAAFKGEYEVAEEIDDDYNMAPAYNDVLTYDVTPQFAPSMQWAGTYTVTYDAEINVEYQISIPYSIASDGKELTIEVARQDMEAYYTYFAIPKLNTDAFLKARIMGWEKYNILPGEANVFFEGTLVGKTFVDARYAEDTLDVSLGNDDRIIIERSKVKDRSGRAIIGGSKKEDHVWEIKVRNGKKSDITIVIEDQVPVSQTTDIEVSNITKDGASFNPETGKLSWDLKIPSGQTSTVRFGFSVKYPKEHNLYIR